MYTALQPALPPAHPHHQIPSLPTGFCSSLAQGMALTSTLMATLPGGFSASPQHQEAAAARKFAPQQLPGGGSNFDKPEALQADAEDGKGFLAKEGSLLAFSAAEAVQASLGESAARATRARGRASSGFPRGTEGMGPCPRGTPAPASPGQRSGKMRPSCARGASAGTGGGLLEPRNEWGGGGGGEGGRAFSAPWPASARSRKSLRRRVWWSLARRPAPGAVTWGPG